MISGINNSKHWYENKKVTVMGLGLHGGGLEVCRFLSRLGAQVTATDLRSPEELAPSLEKLSPFPIRYVLGEHRMEDFTEADVVIKNPAVPVDSPYLKGAKQVETDLSLFLQFTSNPIIAVTGSKGKSTTVTALHHILKGVYPGCRLGGNITVSPLSFMDDLNGDEPVILELSSWQLADLRGRDLLKPEISLITNIMHDHQNRYNSMEEYIQDKEEIFLHQTEDQTALFPLDELGLLWMEKTRAQVSFFSLEGKQDYHRLRFYMEEGRGLARLKGEEVDILPGKLAVPGRHFRGNMLLAGAAALLYGLKPDTVRERLATFPGVPHRMETIRRWKERTFINDTAATIPDALIAALESFEKPPLLICGGTDKELDMSPLDHMKGKAEEVFLLAGSASDRMIPYLEKCGCPWDGPFDNLESAFKAAVEKSAEEDTIILSPGATSFGMFLNEFDRGNQFRALAESLKEN
ncbi:MAG: UDP-N-acetylmuramoyl-L-alanine--D-glutamate ligase [Spirochaetales bacterium]|nr:UDP-N-acetylmuramoyl-L-alanine--D-glutamate ligase [Spirochaetales bacterium]